MSLVVLGFDRRTRREEEDCRATVNCMAAIFSEEMP